MSSPVKKVGRQFKRGPFGSKEKLRTASSQAVEPRKGASAKAREAEKIAARQQQLERVRTAEAESEIALRRAGSGPRGGRRSLIRSSSTGLATNLGGTS